MSNDKILFIDAFSTLHVGNGALLDNSIKACLIKFKSPAFKIITSDIRTNDGRYEEVIEDVFSNYPDSNVKKLVWVSLFFLNCSIAWLFYKLKINRKFIPIGSRFKCIFDAIINSDKIVSISGETLNDNFMPQMYQRCFLFKICISLNKEFYVFPQSIGPIYRKSSFMFLRAMLSNAKEIYGRDKESVQLAEKIWDGCNVKVSYSPDVAVLQESDENKTNSIFQNHKKVIGLTLSDFPNEIKKNGNDIELIVKGCIKSFDPDEFSFFLMPSNYKYDGKSNDYLICESAYDLLTNAGFESTILDDRPIFPEEYQGILKGLFLFISTRMHVGILATTAYTPTVMINTQHKIRGYMANINMTDYVVEVEDIESGLPEKILKSINYNSSIRDALRVENERLKSELTKVLS